MTEDPPHDSSIPASELLRRVIEQLNKAEAETDSEGTQPSELLRQLIAQLANETAAVEARAAELEATLNAGAEPPAEPEPAPPALPAAAPAELSAGLPEAGPLAAVAAELAHGEPPDDPGSPHGVQLEKPPPPDDSESQVPTSPVDPTAPEPEPEPETAVPTTAVPPQSPLVVVMNSPQQTVEGPKRRSPMWWLVAPIGCLVVLCLLLGIAAAALAITGKGQELVAGLPFIGVNKTALVARITEVAKIAPNGQREPAGQNVFGTDNRGISVQVHYLNVPAGYQGQIITQWDLMNGNTATPLRAPEFISITDTYNQTTWWYSYRAPTGLPPGQYRFTLAVAGLNSQQIELGSARFEIRGAAPPSQPPVNPTTPSGPARVPTVAFHTPTPYPSPQPRRTATPLPGNAPASTATPAQPAIQPPRATSPTPYAGPGGRRP